MTINSISSMASTPFSGLGTQTFNVPTTGLWTCGVICTIPWLTSDQPAYGTPAAEVQTVTTVADSSGSLNNTYFTFYTAGNTTGYYVWYNINSAGTDPAVAGLMGIQVAAATNASNSTIAMATQAAIAAVSGIKAVATVAGHVVTIANTQLGACTAAADSASPTGFTFAVTTTGAYGGTSGLNIQIKHNSTVLQTLANPTSSQATLSGAQTVQCSAGDTITVVLASTAPADNAPNAVKGVINVFPGPV